MLNEEYEKGQEIGELRADIKNLERLLENTIAEQKLWNLQMERRASVMETWITTTTGKVVVLTALFSIVGSAAYLIINWFLNHKLK